MPRVPKPADERVRRNSEKPEAVLGEGVAIDPATVPPLPAVMFEVDGDDGEPVESARDWNPATVRWWNALWTSPVSTQYTKTDEFELVRLAQLIDEINWGNLDRNLLQEVRHMTDRFGLSPLARRRLGWVVKTGDVQDTAQPADNVVPISKRIRQRALG